MSTGFFNSAESVVTYAATVVELFLLVRLAWLGLIREFKVFFVFLIYDVVLTAALIGSAYNSYGYERIWSVTTPLWTFLLACASLELLRGLAQPIPRDIINRTVALFGFLIGMTISVGVSMLMHPQAISRPAILLTFMSKQCIVSGCILGVLVQAVYFSLGGLPLIRNWRRHRRVLLAFMAAQVIGAFTATWSNSQIAEWVGLLRDAALLICYCMWIPLFERAWSHLQDYYSAFPFASLSEETEAEIFAYHAREARQSKTAHALPAIFR